MASKKKTKESGNAVLADINDDSNDSKQAPAEKKDNKTVLSKINDKSTRSK